MHIQLNGESRDVRDEITVADLLQEMDIRADRVVVELNLSILERDHFATQHLRADDRVEILSFIGGGAEI